MDDRQAAEAAQLTELNLTSWVIPAWAIAPQGPGGYRPVPCRSCGATVLWVDTRRGRKAPLNADGTSHFSSCPQADAWRRGRG